MRKKILFFTEKPPEDKTAIHIWLGKAVFSHEEHLRRIISQYLRSSNITFATEATGKLYLPGAPLHFNLSDSEDWLAIAFSWEAPVGIDIESIRPIDGMEQLVLDCFSPREQAYVYSSGKRQEEALVRFWEIWNRKEACFKALGLGLQNKMDEWDCYGNDWIFVHGVWVRSLPNRHQLSAAVAIRPLA